MIQAIEQAFIAAKLQAAIIADVKNHIPRPLREVRAMILKKHIDIFRIESLIMRSANKECSIGEVDLFRARTV